MTDVDWILNTPSCKVYWLPDYKHQLQMTIYGNDARMVIINSETNETFHARLISLGCDDKIEMYQEFAKHKYSRIHKAI